MFITLYNFIQGSLDWFFIVPYKFVWVFLQIIHVHVYEKHKIRFSIYVLFVGKSLNSLEYIFGRSEWQHRFHNWKNGKESYNRNLYLFVNVSALSTFLTHDIIIHFYSSRNKSVHYVWHMSKLKDICHGHFIF